VSKRTKTGALMLLLALVLWDYMLRTANPVPVLPMAFLVVGGFFLFWLGD